jgi:hypothetical protein
MCLGVAKEFLSKTTLGGQVLACGPSSGLNFIPRSDTDILGTELGSVKQGGTIRRSGLQNQEI